MFEFLKRFRKEVKEEVDFFELGKWLAPKMEMGITSDFAEMRKIMEDLKGELRVLEGVDVAGMKVEDKLKEFVKGNRKSYLIAMRSFLAQVRQPEKFDHNSLLGFCNGFEKELESLSKKTVKNYYIMKNLIGAELEAVAKGMKKLDLLVKEMKQKITTGKLELMEDVQHKLSEIYLYISEEEKRRKGLDELEKERGRLQEKENELRQELESFRTGSQFREFTELKNKSANLAQKQLDVSNELRSRFSVISRPLRKLEKSKPSRIVENYIENPVDALMEDSHFSIVSQLGQLTEDIKEGRIKEKAGEKILKVLRSMGKEYFRKSREEIKELGEKLRKCNEQIEKVEFESKRDKLVEHLNRLEKELGETGSKIESVKSKRIGQDIDDIEDDLKKLGFKVVIKDAPYD